MPHGRHGTGAAVIGKNLYVAAGSLKPGSGEVTDQLIVVHDALNRGRFRPAESAVFRGLSGPLKVPLTTNL